MHYCFADLGFKGMTTNEYDSNRDDILVFIATFMLGMGRSAQTKGGS